MYDLKQTIEEMHAPLVAETLKNLRISLQHTWNYEVQDDEAIACMQRLQLGGRAGEYNVPQNLDHSIS